MKIVMDGVIANIDKNGELKNPQQYSANILKQTPSDPNRRTCSNPFHFNAQLPPSGKILFCSTECWKMASALRRLTGLGPELTTSESIVYLHSDTLNLKEVEKCAILSALKTVNFSQTKASQLLGISLRKLNYKIVQHGIKHHEWKVNK